MSIRDGKTTNKYFIVGLLCLWFSAAYGQTYQAFPDCETAGFSCPDNNRMLRKIHNLLTAKQALKAYDEFQLLEDCDDCPEHRKIIQELGVTVLDSLKAEYESRADSLKLTLQQADEINKSLSASIKALKKAEEETAQQVQETKRVARTALASNYMLIAEAQLEQNDSSGYAAALWLTDFTYAYLDSTHHDVQRMMYRLFHQHMLDNLPYKLFEEEPIVDEFGEIYEHITTMDWSNDSLWLAIGTDLNRVFVFSQDGEAVFIGSPATGTSIFSLAFNKNNNLLAVASASEVMFVELNRNKWQTLEDRIYRDDFVRVVDWSPVKNRELALAGDESTVFIYNRDWNSPLLIFPTVHTDWIRALSWSPDGKKIASGGDDGRIVLWEGDAEGSRVIDNRIIHRDYISSISWHPSEDKLVSGARDGLIYYQDTDGNIIGENNFNGSILKLAYSASGQQLGILTFNDYFYLLEENQIVNSVILSKNQNSFAWLGEENTVTGTGLAIANKTDQGTYDLPTTTTHQTILDFEIEEGLIAQANWSPDGNILAYVQHNNLYVKQADRLQCIRFENNQIIDIAWHPGLSSLLPSSNFFATIDTDSILAVWDAIDVVVEKNVILTTSANIVSWSPDGNELLIGDDQGQLLIYDADLNFQGSYQVLNDQFNDLAWSPDGKYLVLASNDKTAVVWDYVSKRQKAVLRGGHKDWIQQVVWLNDEEIATCGDDQQIIIWKWDKDAQNYLVSQRLTDLNGLYIGLDLQQTSQFTILVAGTYSGELGTWFRETGLGNKFIFQPENGGFYESGFSTLSWHPNGREVVFSSYARVPEHINMVVDTGIKPSFNLADVTISSRTQNKLNQIASTTLVNSFYLPEVTLPNRRNHLLQWTSDERLMAYADEDYLYIHDYHRKKLIHRDSLDRTPDFLQFSPDNNYLAVANKTQLDLYSATNWSQKTSLPLELSHTDIMHWGWSANSRYLAILTTNYEMIIYDVITNTPQRSDTQIEVLNSDGTFVFHPQNHQQVYIITGKSVYQFDYNQPEIAAQNIFQPVRNDNTSVYETRPKLFWLDEGSTLLVKMPNEQLYTLEVMEGNSRVVEKFGHPGCLAAPFKNLAYEYVPMDYVDFPIQSEKREYLQFWNPYSGEVRRKILAIRQQFSKSIDVSESRNLLAGLGHSLTLYEGRYWIDESQPITLNVWELNEQKELLSLPMPDAVAVKFSPLASHVMVYLSNGKVSVFPLDLPAIADFLYKSDNSRYSPSSRKNELFLTASIDEWGLETGLNVAGFANMTRLKQRESTPRRAAWSKYFLQQARLADDKKQAVDYFSKAQQLHLLDDGSIRPGRSDTLAVADIYLDRTYFYMAQEQVKQARQYLSLAQSKIPSNPLLQQASTLLSWHEGAQEEIFIQLNHQNNQWVDKAYERWKDNGLNLPDNLFFERLLAVHLHQPDPGLLLSGQPSINSLIEDFAPLERDSFLHKYYLVNINIDNIEPEKKAQLYIDAIAFYQSYFKDINDANAPLTEEALFTLTHISDQLVNHLMFHKKYNEALPYSDLNHKTIKSLIRQYQLEEDYLANYLYSIKRHGILMAIKQPNRLAAIYQLIEKAEDFTKTNQHFYLQLLRGHLAAVENNQEKAFRTYFEIMERFSEDSYLSNQLSKEITYDIQPLTIDKSLRSNLLNQLKSYETYHLNVQDLERLWNQKQEAPYLAGDAMKSALENMFSRSLNVVTDAIQFVNQEVISVKAYKQQLNNLDNIGSELAWFYLKENNWEQAERVIEKVRKLSSGSSWPYAIEAIVFSIQEKRIALRTALIVCRTMKNDGYNAATYPTIKQLLSFPNLPENISKNALFLKNKMIWEDSLN